MDAFDAPPDQDSGRKYTAAGIAWRLGAAITPAGVSKARREGRITACEEVVAGEGKVIHVITSAELHRFERCRLAY